MTRYIISFQSPEDVKKFLELINTTQVEFSMKNNIVICSSSEDELAIASNRFGAEVDRLSSAAYG
jgi:hypothetical protein